MTSRRRRDTGIGSLVRRMVAWLGIGSVIALGGVALALASATRVAAAGCNQWSGSVDSNWSTSANWSLGTPISGQSLCFPAGAANAQAMTDDIPGLSVTSLTFSDDRGNTVSGVSLTVSGTPAQISVQSAVPVIFHNPIVVLANTTAAGWVNFDGAVSGGGGFTVVPDAMHRSSARFEAASTFSGGVDLRPGGAADVTVSGGLGSGGVSVELGSELLLGNVSALAAPVVVDNSIAVGGGSTNGGALVCWDATINGSVSLTADTSMDVIGQTCAVHGTISGPFRLALRLPFSGSQLTIDGANIYGGGTSIDGAAFYLATGVVVANGSSPFGSGPVSVGAPSTDADVHGRLSGSGTIGDVTSYGRLLAGDGAAQAGTLTTGTLTLAGGSLAALLTSASSYSTVDAHGPVSISLPTSLDVTLGYVPAAGDSFTLIRNHSGSPVTGRFSGMAEGQHFSAGGWVFSITYTGNAGDDVVITALAPLPPVPATGSAIAPLVATGVAFLLGGLTLLVSARRFGRPIRASR
jgi:hypothetical protein